MLNASSSTRMSSASTSSSPNYIKSQLIQKDLFKLKLQKKYPFLSKWKISCFEFFDESFDSSIRVDDINIGFEFELSEQILESSWSGNEENSIRPRPCKRNSSRKPTSVHPPPFTDEHSSNSYSSFSSDDIDEMINDEDDFLSDDDDDDEGYSLVEDQFVLRGDILWDNEAVARLRTNFDDLVRPILECKLFELLKFNGPNVKLGFDINFEGAKSSTKSIDEPDEIMVLKNIKEKIYLVCQKVSSSENYDKSYDFSSMFNNEFLADFKIKSQNGQTFHIHKSIVWLTLKEKTDAFLNKLSKQNFDSDSLELVLFYCYSGCLPMRLDLKTASAQPEGGELLSLGDEARLKSLVDFLEGYDELSHLNELLRVYMNNFSFKLKTDMLISEIKGCFESVNAHFRYDDNNVMYQRLFLNSSKLCQVIKASFESFYLGFVKIVRLLDMYSQKQKQLSKDEKSELIRKVKNSLPFFLTQLERFLSSIHKHSLQMTDGNKREMAEYMIPEIDVFVKNSLELIKSSESVIERIVNSKKSSEQGGAGPGKSRVDGESESEGEADSSDGGDKSTSTGFKISKKSKKLKTKLGRTIKNAMHLRELKKIQKFNEKANKSFKRIEEIFEKYEKTNQDAKVNLVHKELSSFIDNIVHDIPRVLRKLRDYSNDQNMMLNKALKIYDFKFAFKLLASKTEWFLSELKSNREFVNPYISNLCAKLHNNELNKELEKLDLAPQMSVNPNDILPISGTNRLLNKTNCDFDSFFKSKSAENNRLSHEASELFKSKHLSDLLLELHDEETKEVQLVRVHGSIVASRCVWFQRALSSGMKESIDRKVVLHDRNLGLFVKCFIEYLYSGHLNDDSGTKLTNDELIELLTIADKYECDSLKEIIEKKFIVFLRNQYDLLVKQLKSTSNDAQYSGELISPSSFSLVLIDYLHLSDHFKLDMLLALCVSILVELVEDSGSSDDETKKLDLDSMDEFKQLPPSLQSLVKEKQTQHAKIKEMYLLAKQKKSQKFSQIKHLYRDESSRGANAFIVYDDFTPAVFNLDEEDAESFASTRMTRSRLSGLVPGAPVQTPSQYLSSSSLSLEGLGAAAVVRPPMSRLDELIALADPLIVLDGFLLENSFNQLKEIIGDENTSSTDEQLVKLLIRHDCDLNRVVPIVLNFE